MTGEDENSAPAAVSLCHMVAICACVGEIAGVTARRLKCRKDSQHGVAMSPVTDHPLRYASVNELHARPFPTVGLPSTVTLVAFHQQENPAGRDRSLDLAHLQDLIIRGGGVLPEAGASHYSGTLGRSELKWESHTEFVSYSAFTPGVSTRPFDPAGAAVFPADWMAKAPGLRLISLLVRVEEMPDSEEAMLARLEDWFVPESLAASRIIDGSGVIAGDFRIDPAGHMRFAVFVRPGTGPRRIGRIVQRLCELETYRTMAMLGLMQARSLSAALNELDPRLTALVEGLEAEDGGRTPDQTLHDLLSITAELERLAVGVSFRFGATMAYEAIVHQRVSIMREERLSGRQTFDEFMTRRFDPAMRTVKSSEIRLRALSERAARAAELLRTRVEVERAAENQALLASMDRRADLQLRLQHTVEGLSVVAIGYYAVNLVTYLAYPLASPLGVGKEVLTAALVLPVVGAVWLSLRRIRARFH